MGTFLVLKNNFMRAFKHKGKFLLILLIPTIAIILTVFANSLMKPAITVGVVNNVKCEESTRIINLLNETTGLKIQEANKKTIHTDVIMAKYSAVIDFKKKFNEGDINDLEGDISIYSQKNNIEQDIVKLLKYYISNNESVDFKNFSKEIFQEQMSAAERIMGFIIMCLFITTTMTASIMIRDKEEEILTRFNYSPNKISNYTLGNLIYNFMITYGQLAIAAIITTVFNVNIGISFVQFLGFSLLIAFVATAFGTFIGSAFKTDMQANLAASAIALITSLFGGAFIPIEKMPRGIKLIGNFTPTRWVIDFTSTMESGEVITQGNAALLILVAFGVVCLILSTLLNKRNL